MPSPYRPESELVRQRLLQARHEAAMTQRAVADSWGVPQETISAIERGIRRLDIGELMDLCAILGLDVVELVQEVRDSAVVTGRKRKRLPRGSGKPRRRG